MLRHSSRTVIVHSLVRIAMVFILILSVIPWAANPPSALAASFPYNAQYPHGLLSVASDQSAANQAIRDAWSSWKSNYVTSSGAGGYRRVVSSTGCGSNDTVSEAIGYGMLLSVYLDDRSLFDDLWRYAKLHFNSNGLMGWCIDGNGNPVGSVGGNDSASDADEDMAVALVFAHAKWGSGGAINYNNDGRTLINNMWDHVVDPQTFHFKNGDWDDGSADINPSYFAPAWYRIFASFTGNTGWNNVASKSYEIIGNINRYNNGTGLVPENARLDGTRGSGSYNYGYNAFRYCWRAATDYLWFGTSRGRDDCNRHSTFFKNVGVNNIVDGYTITGTPIGSWRGAAVTSMAAAGFMTGSDTGTARTFYNATVSTVDGDSWGYFGNSLRLLSMLMMTGNFPNLYTNDSGGGDNTRNGSWAAKLVTSGNWKSLVQHPTGIAKNTSYVASVWYKGSGKFHLRVHAGVWGAEIANNNTCTASGSWQKCSVSFNTGNNTQLTFRLTNSNGGGTTIYFDDIYMGPSGGGNKLANAGFESGNTSWYVESPFSIVQNP
ncbi:MAG: hypothetical protein GFH27_549287n218 [Chloroflexi bacterium AL-W]|nr:hypothetical protein [Chloroflexi bacterium AL-N1]NOK66492.1 hypothetical protein [Chloroflexi bacterium AL-N10]NOK71880.1 hypothetical protein [Chloroflexi bacterium AL-N5]NOK81137.1 hypothetical protein [Chloroflexi bacterium AL-W]NOK89410.1 hypothetical protein [Chloroflexi bacterium AL-N15]